MNDEHTSPYGTPSPVEPQHPAPTESPLTARRRRRMIIPALVAALAIGAVGTGAGYAVGTAGQQSSSTGTTSQGATSQQLAPSYGSENTNPYGGQNYGGQSFGDQSFGDQGYGDQGYGDQQTSPYGQGQSSDTTSQASGSQLTGLTRIVSTNSYSGSEGVGTGMVLTSDGEVVTNHHVVEGATTIKVTVMSTGDTYTAKVVGTDASHDVALLDLEDASGLDTVSTDTNAVSVGDAVTAVGDGNGTEDYLSAATGSVLATDQPVTTQDEGTASGESLTGMIQISSDVVPGYSGGATYDADGEVIGMTTAASSGTDDPDGYAIPISTVLSVADDLSNGVSGSDYQYGSPAFLGIGLGTGSGTTVQEAYDGTPAADAGIGAGAQITSVGGTQVQTGTELRAAIASHSAGDEVKITWTDSSGSSHSATVTLAKGPIG